MLGLDVTIDTKSGFCFGVEYAIEIAEEILQQDGELYCLGDIVALIKTKDSDKEWKL